MRVSCAALLIAGCLATVPVWAASTSVSSDNGRTTVTTGNGQPCSIVTGRNGTSTTVTTGNGGATASTTVSPGGRGSSVTTGSGSSGDNSGCTVTRSRK